MLPEKRVGSPFSQSSRLRVVATTVARRPDGNSLLRSKGLFNARRAHCGGGILMSGDTPPSARYSVALQPERIDVGYAPISGPYLKR